MSESFLREPISNASITLDKDCSGALDVSEVRGIMEGLGYTDEAHVDVVDLLIKCADTDGNGEPMIDQNGVRFSPEIRSKDSRIEPNAWHQRDPAPVVYFAWSRGGG